MTAMDALTRVQQVLALPIEVARFDQQERLAPYVDAYGHLAKLDDLTAWYEPRSGEEPASVHMILCSSAGLRLRYAWTVEMLAAHDDAELQGTLLIAWVRAHERAQATGAAF